MSGWRTEAASERVMARTAARAMERPSFSIILGRRGARKAVYASLTPWARATIPATYAAFTGALVVFVAPGGRAVETCKAAFLNEDVSSAGEGPSRAPRKLEECPHPARADPPADPAAWRIPVVGPILWEAACLNAHD